MQDFFDLQLFAEEGASDVSSANTTGGNVESPADTQTVTEPTTADNQTSQTEPAAPAEPKQTEQQPDTAARYLVTDPRTGRKYIVSGDQRQTPPTTPSTTQQAEPAEPQQQEQQTTQQTPPTTPQEPPKQAEQAEPLIHTEPYTLDELNAAIAQNNVNEARIPNQYKFQYAQYRQEQAKRQQQYQAQQLALQQQAQKAQLEQQQKMFADIDAAANKQAMQTLGLTQDDIDTAEYSDDDTIKQKVAHFNTAKAYYKEQLIGAIQQQQMQQQAAQNEQRAIYQSILDFTRQKQTEEPHFNEINQLMGSYYQNMPYKDAATVSDAIKALNDGRINGNQCKVLENYYNEVRTAYYAKANNLTKQPQKVAVPKVETPGTGAKSQPKPFDFTQLRNMNERERRAALSKYWHSK